MLWLLALLAAEVRHRYSMAIALGVMWVLIVGPPPLPDRIDLVLVLLGQGVALALGICVLMRARPTTSEVPSMAVSAGPGFTSPRLSLTLRKTASIEPTRAKSPDQQVKGSEEFTRNSDVVESSHVTFPGSISSHR